MNTFLRMLGLDGLSDVHAVDQVRWQATQVVAPEIVYLLLGLGIVLAGINFLPWIRMRLHVRLASALLRLGMVGILALALLHVELTTKLRLNEKPNWLLLVDDSASMATADEDGAPRYGAALADLRAVRAGVNGKVRLQVDTLAGGPPPETPRGGATLIRRAVARAALAGGAVDQLVLLTDGRDVEGYDFAALGRDLKARGVATAIRVYGADLPPADNSLAAEPERGVIRLGEALTVNGSIAGSAGPDRFRVELRENDKVVKRMEVAGEDRHWFQLSWRPPAKGRHRYTLALVDDDLLPGNNARSFVVDVIEDKIKVLMIEGFPRFEFKLMKVAVEADPLVELTTICHLPGGGLYVQGAPRHSSIEQGLITSQSDLFKYDVVILRDVPRMYFRAGGDTSESRMQLLVRFVLKRGGGLVVLGGEDVFKAGGYQDSPLAAILPFDLSDHFGKDVQFPGLFHVNVVDGLYDHPVLRFFPEPGRSRARWLALRQLDGCNNVGRLKPLATPLLSRTVEIRNERDELVQREAPIMAVQSVGEGRVVAAAVDTLWRWQLQAEFDDPPLQALMANIIRYIAPDPRRSTDAADVAIRDASPQVGQDAVLYTRLRDDNFDPIAKAELKVSVTRPDGTVMRIYPRDLPERPGYYEYRVPLPLRGAYEVAAEYRKVKQSAAFVAGASGIEHADLSADRAGMETLAQAAGGEVVDSVASWLARADLEPSRRPAVRDLPLWNSPLLMLLFILFICIDCYIRKRQGLA